MSIEHLLEEHCCANHKHPFFKSIYTVLERMPWIAHQLQTFPNKIHDRESFFNFLCREFDNWMENYIRVYDVKRHAIVPSHEMIAKEAYFLWQLKDCPCGRDQEFWFEAKSNLVLARLSNLRLKQPYCDQEFIGK